MVVVIVVAIVVLRRRRHSEKETADEGKYPFDDKECPKKLCSFCVAAVEEL